MVTLNVALLIVFVGISVACWLALK